MFKSGKWLVFFGILLVIGGAVIVTLNLKKNLPSPFDIASAGNDSSLPIIAPAMQSGTNQAEVATPAGAPTIDTGADYSLLNPSSNNWSPGTTPAVPTAENVGNSINSTPTVTPRPVGLVPDRLAIPAIDLDAPIIPVSYKEIKAGKQIYYQWLAPDQNAVGWQDSSALLGLPGNTVLDGHHNEYGMVFKDLVKLNLGDYITIYSGSQDFHYQVVAKMLLPERFTSLSNRLENARWIENSTDERITLITCWPADSNTHRVVIVAFPVTARTPAPTSTPVAQPQTATICKDDATITVDLSDLSQYPGYTEGPCKSYSDGLKIKVSVDEASYTYVGDALHFNYLVTNSGSVALTDVRVTDNRTTVACPRDSLQPLGSMTCTATYRVSNADLSHENITGISHASGSFETMPVTSGSVSTVVLRFLKLTLNAKCASPSQKNNAWQVTNNNPYPVGFEYAIDGGVAGVGFVSANSIARFETPVGSGTGVLSLYVGGYLQVNANVLKGCY
jgi:LPXTG-site transpeptidase (sortase) family protein